MNQAPSTALARAMALLAQGFTAEQANRSTGVALSLIYRQAVRQWVARRHPQQQSQGEQA